MIFVTAELDLTELLVGHFDFVSYSFVSRTALTLSPVRVLVPPIRLTMVYEKSRRSILFHLLVPGG